MRHIWKVQILGAGVLTPALAGLPHAAAARSVDMAPHNIASSLSVSSNELEIRVLQEGMFVLTPTQKLEIGGDRIRLAKGAVRSNTRITQSGHRAQMNRSTHALCKLSVSRCPQTRTC
jgi:hypothetical protein